MTMTAALNLAALYSNGSEFPSLKVRRKGLNALEEYARRVISGNIGHAATKADLFPVDCAIWRTGVCGVYATAAATGRPFGEVYAYFRKAIGKGFKGGTTHDDRLAALRHFGTSYTEIEVTKRMSLLTFVRDHAEPGKAYMVRTPQHVQMVKDGLVMDQTGPVDAAEYWHAGKTVTRITEIH